MSLAPAHPRLGTIVVLHDQHDCSKNTPFSELQKNTTWNLIADIEKLHQHLGIDR